MHRLLLVLVGAVALSACSSTTQAMRVPKIGVVARDLERNEYVVLGNAEGKSCVEQSCFLGIFCTVKDEGGKTIAGAAGQSGVTAAAYDQAMLQALKAQPEADAVFAPRESTSLEIGSQIITTSIKACTRIYGKSVRIKTDEEMGGAPPPASAAAVTPTSPAG